MASLHHNQQFQKEYEGPPQDITDAAYDFVERNWTRTSRLGPVLRPRHEVEAFILRPQSLGPRPLDRALQIIARLRGDSDPHPGDPL